MMYCHNCGARIADSEDKYCTTCGARLHPSPVTATPPASPASPPAPGPTTPREDEFFGGLRTRAGVEETRSPPPHEERSQVIEADQPDLRSPLPLDDLRQGLASSREGSGGPATRPVAPPRPLPVEEQRQRLSEEDERRNTRHLEQARRSTPVRSERPRLREAKGWVPWPETVQEKEQESPAERLNRMVPGAVPQKEHLPPAEVHRPDESAERLPPAQVAPSVPPVEKKPVPPAHAPRPPAPAVPEEDPIIPWVTPLPITPPEPVKKVPLYEVPKRPPAPPRHPSRQRRGRFGGSGFFEGDGRGIKPSWILAIAGLIVLTLVIFTIFPVQESTDQQGRHLKINPLTGGIVNSTTAPTTAPGADSTDLQVTINYKGTWTGKIVSSGSIYREIPISGVGIKVIPVNQQSGVVSVQAQKKDDSREAMTVTIGRGTTILKEGSTIDPSGSLTVSTALS